MKRFKGVFNWYGELIILWRYAYSLAQAKEYFYRAIAQKKGRIVWRVRSYFEGSNHFVVKEA